MKWQYIHCLSLHLDETVLPEMQGQFVRRRTEQGYMRPYSLMLKLPATKVPSYSRYHNATPMVNAPLFLYCLALGQSCMSLTYVILLYHRCMPQLQIFNEWSNYFMSLSFINPSNNENSLVTKSDNQTYGQPFVEALAHQSL